MNRVRSFPACGFTLVEMLIVISIIGMLLVVLIVGVSWPKEAARMAKTKAFIGGIQNACASYRENFGAGRDYPPMDKSANNSADVTNGDSSKNLYSYLGIHLKKQVAYSAAAGVPIQPAQEQPALFVFNGDDQVENGCLVDAWRRRILYCFYNPQAKTEPLDGIRMDTFRGGGFLGHDQRYSGTDAHIDIVSYGPYEAGQDEDGTDCKISTFRAP